MHYAYLLKNKFLFPYVVGITYSQFELLLPKFSYALRIAEQKKAYEKMRIRDIGAGRKATLKTDRQKLFFILCYYKVYPTFRFAQVLFEFAYSNIYLWKEFFEPVLFKALGYELELPETQVNGLTGLMTICPALKEFIVDATERPIQRPKNNTMQRTYYSGKKKRHTVKNQLVVHPQNTRILTVSFTVEGKRHDKKLLETDPTLLRAPPNAHGLGDLGYQKATAINPLIRLITPFKKPKGKELTESQKETNKALFSMRVRVEHVISYLKHFNILSHRFRNTIDKADQPFMTLACLYNFTRTYR